MPDAAAEVGPPRRQPIPPVPPGRRRNPAGAAVVVAAGLAVGLAFTWPLALHLTTGLPYAAVPPPGREIAWRAQGDYLQFHYYLWLVGDRLQAGASPLRDPYQFAVDGPRWNLPNLFLPFALIYVPLSVAGPLLAYNLLVLLSFPAACLTAWLLARRLGLASGPAAVAGVGFAVAPYRIGALLGGHPAGFAYAFVPLALWGVEGVLAGSATNAAWGAVALVSLAIVEPHYFYFAALGLPLYVAARLTLPAWRRELAHPGAPATTAALLAAAGLAAGVVRLLDLQGWSPGPAARISVGAVLFLVTLGLWQLGAAGLLGSGAVATPRAAVGRSALLCLPWVLLAVVRPRSGSPAVAALLLVPLLAHLAAIGRALMRSPRPGWASAGPLAAVAAGGLAGSAFLLLLRQLLLTRSVSGTGRTLHEVLLFSPEPRDLLIRVNPVAGAAIYPGLVALALAVIAVVSWLRRPPPPGGRPLVLFALALPLATALALGPRLPALPLFEVAFRLVPGWHFIRQPAKLEVVAGLALALLAGAGAQILGRAWPGRAGRMIVAAGLSLAVTADCHPWRPAGVSLLPGPGIVLARIREAGPRVLYLPLWPGDSSYSSLYLHTTTLTRVPLLNGYSAWVDRSYVSEVYHPLAAANLGVVGDAEHVVLVRLGVRQVVLDREAFPPKVSPFGPALTLAGLRRSPYLEPGPRPPPGEGMWTFRVRDTPRPVTGALPTSPVGVYWEAESLAHTTGRVVAAPEAWGGQVVTGEAGRDRPGHLTFGPYRLLPPGRYRATFRLRGSAGSVVVQVSTRAGVLGEQVVPASGPVFQEVTVPFTLPAPAPLEYRTRWDGQGTWQVDAVTVVFADEPDPAPSFEVERLPHELVERPDPAASEGLAGHAEPGRTPRDVVWSGPWRRYPAGRYRLLVRVRVDGAPAPGTPLARCGVRPAWSGAELAGRSLLASEVPPGSGYVELAVPFSLAVPTVVELPCRYEGRAGVWFDRLAVEGPLAP